MEISEVERKQTVPLNCQEVSLKVNEHRKKNFILDPYFGSMVRYGQTANITHSERSLMPSNGP